MLNQFCKSFLKNKNEKNAAKVIKAARYADMCHIGNIIGQYLEKKFNSSTFILHELALCAEETNNHNLSFDIYQNLLKNINLNEQELEILLSKQNEISRKIVDRYNFYNQEKVDYLVNRPERTIKFVTLSMTTCKRFDLFEQTMNTLLNCFDIEEIDEFFIVDDNSSDDDREKMKELYPFCNFYFKTLEEKGHPQSMNIIKNYVKTEYLMHLEDDWKFFVKMDYIKKAKDVLSALDPVKQCLFNKNYGETLNDIKIKGGQLVVNKNTSSRFYIHEFVQTQEEKEKWTEKHGVTGMHCNYWAHFSFRPSLIKTSIFKELGDFNEDVSHFEMDYAYKYYNKGYLSAFFESIYCIHTGRLTSERGDSSKTNAYTLNDELQFSGKEKQKLLKSTLEGNKIKTYVVNMEKRLDRWQKMEDELKPYTSLNYERFDAVDGSKLKTNAQLQRIFDGNDYNMRVGLVGCAMSHIKLFTDIINSDYENFIILEDDVELTPNFDLKLAHIFEQLKKVEWDFIFLGHHLRDLEDKDQHYDKQNYPDIEKWNTNISFLNSLGGTGGYIINKKGALRLLDFINGRGMTNGIDTMMQKAADSLKVYYMSPHMIFTDCYRPTNKSLDTDIQFNYDSLTLPLEDRLAEEIEFYEKNCLHKLVNFDKIAAITKYCTDKKYNNPCYYRGDKADIKDLISKCVHPCYTLDDKILFVVPNGINGRYFERLKKDGEYDVSDSLIY